MEDKQNTTNHLPQNRAVAFLDILGFREIITSMQGKPETYSLIETILKDVENEQREHRKDVEEAKKLGIQKNHISYLNMEQAQFSDSFVVSIPLDGNFDNLSISTIINYARSLASKLLLKGIYVRGGISSGWTYHSRNVIFGEGMIKAYKLENSVSRVPRIVLASHLKDEINQWMIDEKLKRDSDGFYFINVFSELHGGSLHPEPDSSQFNQAREHLDKALDDAFESNRPDLISKYSWLAREFNEAIDIHSKEPNFNGVKKIFLKE